ncbi:hypothetical protein E5A73_19680 [Sphingomonas gei]|uniref:Methylase n=1 Tax=Sphingomonas gei TaxID=1395960 RepID=A0A4S1X2L8_9SPHN|nr:hypothetical protein [Sphingomonas gei]TGX49070.1 hypothetical protein E5A73_19680 [Sphingomonas gei]
MTDLFHAANRADHEAARQLLPLLSSGETITRRHLNQAMMAAYGGSDAEGRWTQRESFEILEHALALHIRASNLTLNAFDDVRPIINLVTRLPTQTVRSEEQIEWQQFSTPVDIAAVAVLLANVQPDDVILEPSAGNGLLVALLGDHLALHLNELDPARRGRLAAVFPAATITGHDGATLNSSLATIERPTLIIMNPPFSRSLGRGADDFAAVRHLQAALRRLLPGGRLVAIMPDWFGPSARMRDQYETVLRDLTVRTTIRLEKCYLKHGTSIAVRLFVIDKVPGKAPPAIIQRSSVAELIETLNIHERGPARADLPAPVSLERILHIADGDATAEFLTNTKSGKVALQTKARALMEEKEGTPIPRVELMRPTRREYMREHELFESAWTTIDREAFSAKWREEAEEASNKTDTETVRLATGLLLPIWSALPSDHLVVNRIADKAGNSWLGRLVFDEHVVQLFTKLGIDRAENLPPQDIVKSAFSGRAVDLARPFPMTIRRALVNGSPRIELVGAPSQQLAWLKSIGCFTEVIQYRTRVFLPVPTAAETLDRILLGAS